MISEAQSLIQIVDSFRSESHAWIFGWGGQETSVPLQANANAQYY